MVDRRTFVCTLASGLLASPVRAIAQRTANPPRIGVLGGGDSPSWRALREALRDLGYVDRQLEWRWSAGRPDRLPALARELVESNVDIIVAGGTQAVRAAMQASSTIPVVMAVTSYPDKVGLVKSLARPGGNVTGLSNFGPELIGKSFQLLKEIAPTVSRVATLWNPASPVEAWYSRKSWVRRPGSAWKSSRSRWVRRTATPRHSRRSPRGVPMPCLLWATR